MHSWFTVLVVVFLRRSLQSRLTYEMWDPHCAIRNRKVNVNDRYLISIRIITCLDFDLHSHGILQRNLKRGNVRGRTKFDMKSS